jgi:GntR family transcriptional regulator, transcriptional repressor for pyruvate dehydrogenase complex
MEPIKRISLTDEVVTSIKKLVVSGEYKVGYKIPSDTELCKQLGVSRPTLREAIKVLSAMGYIDIVVGKGAFIADLTKKDIVSDPQRLSNIQVFREFMQVRIALEPAAMELAILKIDAGKIEELESIQAAFNEAVNIKDTVKLLMLDEAFHASIIRYSGNKIMMEINKNLYEKIRQFRVDSFSNNKIYQNALNPHGLIIYYMKQKNAEKSIETLKLHLQAVENDIGDMLNGNT